uniref:Potassium channel domain-containing protein n=1 Tax=Ascaris lumbricoides TaxID=6252 RepID=A0A9J2PWN6_ASCLU
MLSGYGNVAPQTTEGRLFVILYGLIGIPFTMLAIANLGKFLAEMLKSWTRPLIGICKSRGMSRKGTKEKQALVEIGNKNAGNTTEGKENDEVSLAASTTKEVCDFSLFFLLIKCVFLIKLNITFVNVDIEVETTLLHLFLLSKYSLLDVFFHIVLWL